MALYINACKKNGIDRKWMIIVWFVIVTLLTWMKPYFILLLFPPIYFWSKSENYKRRKVIIGGVIAVADITVYFIINKSMCAPYFTPLFKLEWLQSIVESPIHGIYNALSQVIVGIYDFFQYAAAGMMNGNTSGAWCTAYIGIFFYYIYKIEQNIKYKRRENVIQYIYWIVAMTCMVCATILIYDIYHGSRHFTEFIVIGIFIVSMCTDCTSRHTLLQEGLWCWLFIIIGTSSYDYSLPIGETELKIQDESRTEMLKSIVDENGSEWDNTIVWVLSDGQDSVRWQELYTLPAGMGINICEEWWVIENFDILKSKYLFTNQTGGIDQQCELSGLTLEAEFGSSHVWRLRD